MKIHFVCVRVCVCMKFSLKIFYVNHILLKFIIFTIWCAMIDFQTNLTAKLFHVKTRNQKPMSEYVGDIWTSNDCKKNANFMELRTHRLYCLYWTFGTLIRATLSSSYFFSKFPWIYSICSKLFSLLTCLKGIVLTKAPLNHLNGIQRT